MFLFHQIKHASFFSNNWPKLPNVCVITSTGENGKLRKTHILYHLKILQLNQAISYAHSGKYIYQFHNYLNNMISVSNMVQYF